MSARRHFKSPFVARGTGGFSVIPVTAEGNLGWRQQEARRRINLERLACAVCGLKFELFKTCRHSALTEHTCLQKQSPTQVTGTQCLLFKASIANKSQRTPMCAYSCSDNRSAPLARNQRQAWRARGTHSPIFSSVEATAMRLMLCR